MSGNYFEENNKFWSFTGTLGRRGYILNYLIVQVITSLIFMTPLFYIIILNPNVISSFKLNAASGEFTQPMWIMIFSLFASLVECVLIYPSVLRRVKDIIAEDEESRVTVISSILILIVFCSSAPIFVSAPILKMFAAFILISLMFMNGKITGNKPKDEVKRFNWGAFAGTWLWGIFNKAPKTLLILPLLFTTAWLPFMVICGIKGNEWAYKNNKKSLEEFHQNQFIQSGIFLVITPIIAFFTMILLMAATGRILYTHPTTSQKVNTKIEAWAEQYADAAVNLYFTKIELYETENKFYMEPQIWLSLSEQKRATMFQDVVNYALVKENKQTASKETEETMLPKFKQTAQKTKILSAFNNEILAEYKAEENEDNTEDLVINNHPTVP